MKKQILSILLTLCMVMCLAPTAVLAAPAVTETADFTAADGGTAAIALLNSAKTGAEDSTWDNSTMTLTLRGIDFTTTATTAVKLPEGATVILADDTENTITGGSATVSQYGAPYNKIYTCGIWAVGTLTIRGETKNTGTLYVNSGKHINSGDAWTYSVAIYADSSLTIKGGTVTAQGEEASALNGGFSYGIQIDNGGDLFVTGGTLTGIGGESFNTEDPNNVFKTTSTGICINCGNVTVSGSGKLIGKVVPNMEDAGISDALSISLGDLYVSDSASVTATAGTAIDIYDGELKLSGGRINAVGTVEDQSAVSVTKHDYKVTANGNIDITGGVFECTGGIYMYQSTRAEGVGVLTVTGGKLTTSHIYGSSVFAVSGGTVTSGYINADAVELTSGSLIVRESVKKNQWTEKLYVSHAIYCKKLTVSGGTLDAAWEWGEYTPSVLPIDSSWGIPTPMIKMFGGTATFSGGTVILDTGCAGNTAIKVETLNLMSDIEGTGYTKEEGSDAYIQKDSDIPVKFTVRSADYSKVDEVIKKANALNKNNYKDFSAVQAAIDAVVRGKSITEQAEVDAMAKAIEDAMAALEYKDADYSKVDAAIARVNALNKNDYKDFSAVEAAVKAVIRGKNITEQAEVDAMAKAIEEAINALEKKSADTKPTTSEAEESTETTEEGKPDTTSTTEKQDKADGKVPQTGDNSRLMLWIVLLVINGSVLTGVTVIDRKKKEEKR